MSNPEDSLFKKEHLLRPIGIFRCQRKKSYESPRQPHLDQTKEIGKIILFSKNNFEQALHGLELFKKIWILFLFDRAKNWKPQVAPPSGTDKKWGVFATRSPHRPNFIGMSAVNLERIEGRNLFISQFDLIDKTAVIDIKPYLAEYDSYPADNSGWKSSRESQWAEYKVFWSEAAQTVLLNEAERFPPNFKETIERQLRDQPFNRSHKRIRLSEEGAAGNANQQNGAKTFELSIQTYRIRGVYFDRGFWIEALI